MFFFGLEFSNILCLNFRILYSDYHLLRVLLRFIIVKLCEYWQFSFCDTMGSVHAVSVLLLFLLFQLSDSRHLHITDSQFSLDKVRGLHFLAHQLFYFTFKFSELAESVFSSYLNNFFYVFMWFRIKMSSLVWHLKNRLEFLGLCWA